MTLSKTLGTILYELYGPNGSDGFVYRGEAHRFNVFRELERHGLVDLVERTNPTGFGLFDVRRKCRGLNVS